MRKADNTIVFGSQNTTSSDELPPSIPIPPPEPTVPVRMRPLAEDLVDDRRYIERPERGLAFVAASVALVGIAAAGTYFFFGGREPAVSSTSTTSAEVQPTATATAQPPATPPPAEPATPTPTTTAPEQPWKAPEVDAVRAPGLEKAKVPREIPGPQLTPTERPQAANQAPPAPASDAYASKIRGAKFPGVPTAKETPSSPPPPGMSDEALERAGYYGKITPIAPTSTANAGEPKAPSAASTEEPKQFTPPETQLKE